MHKLNRHNYGYTGSPLGKLSGLKPFCLGPNGRCSRNRIVLIPTSSGSDVEGDLQETFKG